MDAGGNRSESSDILIIYPPLFRIYIDGRFERMGETAPIPPSLDPQTRVESKDIKIFHKMGTNTDAYIFVRLFKPNISQNPKKIPIMVYFHGGSFCTQSTFSPTYHHYLNNLASKAQVLIVSVEYRLAPEHPLPIAYGDCWHALNWVASHALITNEDGRSSLRTTTTHSNYPTSDMHNLTFNQSNKDAWLLDHADFSRLFLAGDSSGANFAHQMALRVGLEGLAGGLINQISGLVMYHPFFWGKDRIGNEVANCKHLYRPDGIDIMWAYLCPSSSNGTDDPLFNPAKDPNLSRLGCQRVLIFVSGNDFLRDRGVYYKEVLEKSGWQGKAELVEYKGEDHTFHLLKPSSPNALDIMLRVVDFLNAAPDVNGIHVFERPSWSRL